LKIQAFYEITLCLWVSNFRSVEGS